MIKRFLTALLLFPTVVSAHPGHDGLTSFIHPSRHVLSGMEPTLIYTGLALLAVAAIWLASRR